MNKVSASVPGWIKPLMGRSVARETIVDTVRCRASYEFCGINYVDQSGARFALDIAHLPADVQAEAIGKLMPQERACAISAMEIAGTLDSKVISQMSPQVFAGALSILPTSPAANTLKALVNAKEFQFLADTLPYVNLDMNINTINDIRFFNLPYKDDSKTRVPVLSRISSDNILGALTGRLRLFGYFQFDPLTQRASGIADMLATAGGNFSVALNAGLLQMPVETATSIVSNMSQSSQMALFRNWGNGIRETDFTPEAISRNNSNFNFARAIIREIPSLRHLIVTGELGQGYIGLS